MQALRDAYDTLAAVAQRETVEPYTVDEFKNRLAPCERGEPAAFDARTAAQNCNALPD